MKPGFEQTLRDFSEVAKDELKKSPGEDLADLSKVIDWHLDKAAEKHKNSSQVQREIYEIQKEKQKIMERLKSDLSCLDNPECDYEKKENERLAQFHSETKTFTYRDDLGREQIATFGEILTDMDLDINYYLDKKSIPRTMLKKYLIERVKKELFRLLNLQIIEGGDKINPMAALRWKYKTSSSKIKNLKIEHQATRGFIAEVLVENFLKQLSIDNDLPFEIKEADVSEDVEQKIDFIIRRKEKQRGVSAEADETNKSIGIQFTIMKKHLSRKGEQVSEAKKKLRADGGSRIQDIILVSVPLKAINGIYNRWKKQGRRAGGFSKFLTREEASKLWFNLTKKILTNEESAAYWEKIKDKFSTAQ